MNTSEEYTRAGQFISQSVQKINSVEDVPKVLEDIFAALSSIYEDKEVSKKCTMVALAMQPKHNERGAGRKKNNAEQVQRQCAFFDLYEKGLSKKEIMKKMNISSNTTYYRYKHQYEFEQEVNNPAPEQETPAADPEPDIKWAELEGSERQIKWASDNRAGFIDIAHNIYADAPTGNSFAKSSVGHLAIFAAEHISSAKWWIDVIYYDIAKLEELDGEQYINARNEIIKKVQAAILDDENLADTYRTEREEILKQCDLLY